MEDQIVCSSFFFGGKHNNERTAIFPPIARRPAVKYRYLKAGFEIVGDHEQAAEAKKVFDYYKDLVHEIKQETVIDGSSVIGHTQPFGVFVFLRHIREIERESGGFGRYLQNQNIANIMFVYNYGRPTARKLQIAQILDEHQAGQGKLALEIKTTALGLVPELDQILTLAPDGFAFG